jgi:hypothetical protein
MVGLTNTQWIFKLMIKPKAVGDFKSMFTHNPFHLGSFEITPSPQVDLMLIDWKMRN